MFEVVENGWIGFDDDFKCQVWMFVDMFGGVLIDDYLKKMDCVGIEWLLLIVVCVGDLCVCGFWEILYKVIVDIVVQYLDCFLGFVGIDQICGMEGLCDLM